MKKKRVFLFIYFAIGLLLAGTLVIWESLDFKGTSREESEGASDDPNARAIFEWKRTRDPKTQKIPDHIYTKELSFAVKLPRVDLLDEGRIIKSKSLGKTATVDWTKRGPTNIGGRTRALGVDINNENLILAGGVSGGLWRSTNRGTSWTKTTNASALQSITCWLKTPDQERQILGMYGTGEYVGKPPGIWNSAGVLGSTFLGYPGDGLMKSIDDGVSWAQLQSTVSGTPQEEHAFQSVWRIVTDPANASQDVVYVASSGGGYGTIREYQREALG